MKFEFVPWPNFADRMLNEMNSGGKLCDLLIGDSQWIGGAAENGNYVKLNDFFDKEGIKMSDFAPATVYAYSTWPKGTPNYWPLPAMGEFFHCTDFGYCDPCHENSGHGAFRDATGQVFRRTTGDARIYLQWMDAAAITAVARRYFAQGDLGEAKHAFLAALGKRQKAGQGDDGETWADLGVTLYDSGDKRQSLAALLHAIESGVTRTETVASALVVARELDMTVFARQRILARVPAQILTQIENALDQARQPQPQ